MSKRVRQSLYAGSNHEYKSQLTLKLSQTVSEEILQKPSPEAETWKSGNREMSKLRCKFIESILCLQINLRVYRPKGGKLAISFLLTVSRLQAASDPCHGMGADNQVREQMETLKPGPCLPNATQSDQQTS